LSHWLRTPSQKKVSLQPCVAAEHLPKIKRPAASSMKIKKQRVPPVVAATVNPPGQGRLAVDETFKFMKAAATAFFPASFFK
jgi:hypothetical protein